MSDADEESRRMATRSSRNNSGAVSSSSSSAPTTLRVIASTVTEPTLNMPTTPAQLTEMIVSVEATALTNQQPGNRDLFNAAAEVPTRLLASAGVPPLNRTVKIHSMESKTITPIYFRFQVNKCTFGDKCKYRHIENPNFTPRDNKENKDNNGADKEKFTLKMPHKKFTPTNNNRLVGPPRGKSLDGQAPTYIPQCWNLRIYICSPLHRPRITPGISSLYQVQACNSAHCSDGPPISFTS